MDTAPESLADGDAWSAVGALLLLIVSGLAYYWKFLRTPQSKRCPRCAARAERGRSRAIGPHSSGQGAQVPKLGTPRRLRGVAYRCTACGFAFDRTGAEIDREFVDL